eukprot:gene22841-30014_t
MADRSALLLPLCRYIGLSRSALASFREASLAAPASVDLGSSIGPSSQVGPSQRCDFSSSSQACSPPSALPGPNSKWRLGRHSLSFSHTTSLGLGTRSYAKKVETTYVTLDEPIRDTYISEPTNYIQLLGALRHADDLGRMSHLVSTYSDRFDAVHLAAAIARLPKLLQFRSKDMVPTGVVAPMHSGFRGSAPVPGSKPRPSQLEEAGKILNELKALLPQHVPRFFPRQVTPTRSDEGVLGLLMGPLKRNNYEDLFKHGQACEVTQLLKGLSQLSVSKDIPLLSKVATFVMERSSEFTPNEIHTVARAFTTLKYIELELFVKLKQVILEWKVEQIKTLTPQGIASLMTSFALSDGKRQHKDLFEVLVEGVEPQMVLLTPKEITSIAYACAQQGFVDEALLAHLCKKSLLMLEKFSQDQISSLLESLATLQFAGSQPLFAAVVKSVMAERDIDPVVNPKMVARMMKASVDSGCAERDIDPAINPTMVARMMKAYVDSGFAERDIDPAVNPKMVARMMKAYADSGCAERDIDPTMNPKMVARMMKAYVDSGFVGGQDSKARTMLDRLLQNAVSKELRGTTHRVIATLCTSLAKLKAEEVLSPVHQDFLMMASIKAEQ